MFFKIIIRDVHRIILHIPEPWGKELIDNYNRLSQDTLGKMITFLQEKLSEWCDEVTLYKRSKRLKRKFACCSDNTISPTMIGVTRHIIIKR